jgi:trigger factor
MTKKSTRILAIVLVFAILGGALLASGLLTGKGHNSGPAINYSEGLDKNGFIKGVKASDYVTLPDYFSWKMPKEMTVASEESLDNRVENIINNFTTEEKETDKSVEIKDGTKVNIDYVGKIDNKEFEGGSTDGKGTDVIIGRSQYIDGFLDQLIGHKSGDEFDINVKFPNDYNNSDLAGKDAVFHISINNLYKTVVPSLDDKFVSEKLSDFGYGNTVEEFYKERARMIVNEQQKTYIMQKLLDESKVENIPDKAIDFEKNKIKNQMAGYAAQYGYSLEDFVKSMNFETVDDYFKSIEEDIKNTARYDITFQAIAEKENIKVSKDRLKAFFKEYYGTEDYSMFENTYGLGYIKMPIFRDLAMEKIIENMTVEDSAINDQGNTESN